MNARATNTTRSTAIMLDGLALSWTRPFRIAALPSHALRQRYSATPLPAGQTTQFWIDL